MQDLKVLQLYLEVIAVLVLSKFLRLLVETNVNAQEFGLCNLLPHTHLGCEAIEVELSSDCINLIHRFLALLFLLFLLFSQQGGLRLCKVTIIAPREILHDALHDFPDAVLRELSLCQPHINFCIDLRVSLADFFLICAFLFILLFDVLFWRSGIYYCLDFFQVLFVFFFLPWAQLS